MTATARWAQTLEDASRPTGERAAAARALAALGTGQAMTVLAAALDPGPPSLRAAVTEALGLAEHPRARELVGALLDDPDPRVGSAAVRALAWRRDDEAVSSRASRTSNSPFRGLK